MKNYFFIYRPFHYEYSKIICQTYLSNDENVFVNHSQQVKDNTQGLQQLKIINVPEPLWGRIKAIRVFKNELLAEIKLGQETTIFIPHTLGILANYAYYRLAIKYKHVKICVFYEGVIVFYNYEHGYLRNLLHYFSRVIIAAICNIPFTINKKLLNLLDPRIEKIYSPFLNIPADRSKIICTPLAKVNYEPLNDTCIILGLSLNKKYNAEVKRIIASMFEKLDQLQVKTIYFKDHPSEKNVLFEEVAKKKNKQLIHINERKPIENIIVNYKPKYVISIWSSGIINLSNILPNDIKLMCFVTDIIIDSPELKKLVAVFKDQGIEVLSV